MSRWHKTEFEYLPERAFMVRPCGGMTLEGKSNGSNSPAPDPLLVAAQVKNLGIQDAMIEQVIANTEAMAPLQKEQTEFALQTSKSAWQQSQQDRDYALGQRNKLTGLQGNLVSDAQTFNAEAKADELAGKAGADVSSAYTSAQRTQAAEMARLGINPADAKYGAASDALTANTALASAQARNSARTQARAEGYALTDRATNALAGYPAMGMQTTAATQGYGAAGMNIANSGLAGLNSGYSQAGGMAGNATNSATNAYSSQSSAYNASQGVAAQQDGNTGALVGIGVSAAIAI